jgi:hypothetical protein
MPPGLFNAGIGNTGSMDEAQKKVLLPLEGYSQILAFVFREIRPDFV